MLVYLRIVRIYNKDVIMEGGRVKTKCNMFNESFVS